MAFPGGWEWAIIILVVIVLFGAKRLPDVGKSLGQGIRSFKKELRNASEDDDSPSDTSEKT